MMDGLLSPVVFLARFFLLIRPARIRIHPLVGCLMKEYVHSLIRYSEKSLPILIGLSQGRRSSMVLHKNTYPGLGGLMRNPIFSTGPGMSTGTGIPGGFGRIIEVHDNLQVIEE